jgi:hypothetical protein
MQRGFNKDEALWLSNYCISMSSLIQQLVPYQINYLTQTTTKLVLVDYK